MTDGGRVGVRAALALAAALLLAACADADAGPAPADGAAPPAASPAAAGEPAPKPVSAIEEAAARGLTITPPTGNDENVAPEFTGLTKWLNSPPLTMTGLLGGVVLVDFWTYT